MNLLFYAPQMALYGGMERHICTLAAAAATQGHHVRFLTTSNSLGTELRSLLQSPLIDFRELPCERMHAAAHKKALWLMRQIFTARLRTWDAIYTNGQSAFASWVWHAKARHNHIVHHHHTAADTGEQLSWSESYKRVLTQAHTLVGCSEATCQSISEVINRSAQPRFIPYLTRCVMESEGVRERVPTPALHFGFLGRLVKEKGVDTVLALSQHPLLGDISWQIHGEGPAYPESVFAQYPKVSYHGAYRSAEKHQEILTNLDAVVLLSTHNEGMPLSLIEAMSAGRPWIATDRGGTRELARSPNDCLVLKPTDSLEQTAVQIRHFADSILAGTVSRLRQRRAYEAFLSPSLVAPAWLELLTGKSRLN